MKKLIYIFILVFVFFLFIPLNTNANVENVNSHFLYSGISIANIDLSSFIAKYPNIPVSAVFVEKPESLIDVENIAYKHNARVFVKLDLFLYLLENSRPSNLSDLKKFYETSEPFDLVEKQKILSAISSLYEVKGIPLTEVKKSEPDIVVTYRYESSKSGYIAIPIRTPKVKNTLTTYFFLDPLKFPFKDTTQYYRFIKSEVINQSAILSKIARSKYQNSYLDFDGFYIQLPDLVDFNYESIVKKTIQHLKRDIGQKLIVFTNITENNVNSVKDLGDVFVVNVFGDSFSKLESLRRILSSKTIIANYNGNLNGSEIENFLKECSLLGIVPQFGRDLKTNEFFYYEQSFSDFTKEILNASDIIKRVLPLTFSNFRQYRDYSVSEFSGENVLSYIYAGRGKINQHLTIKSEDNIYINGNVKGWEIQKVNTGIYLNFDLDGTAIVEVFKKDFFPIAVTNKPASDRYLSIILTNGTNKNISKYINFDVSGVKREINLDFQPFEMKEFTLGENEKIVFENFSFENPKIFNYIKIQLIPIIFLFVLSIVFFKKKFYVKRIFENKVLFVLSSIFITALISLINLLFLGYDLTAILYIAVSAIFFIYALSRGDSRIFAFSLLFIALFWIYNIIEFGSIIPEPPTLLLPYPSFQISLFYFPIVFPMVILLTFKRRISRSEIIGVILVLLTLISFKWLPFFLPERTELFTYIPFVIIFLVSFIFILVDIQVKNKLFSTFCFALSVFIIIGTIFINRFIVLHITELSIFTYPLSYLFIVLLSLIFAILLEKEKSRSNQNFDISIFVLVLTALFFASSFLVAWGMLGLGISIFAGMISYLFQIIPVILFLFLIFEVS
ncbi:MAG: hypothetical protein ACP5QM_01745 [Caldisericum sp.]|uniref:hypothetical protein n=1 Tax=Caldisericum sp. TaxID=2499687 RepID=UPI003D1392B4